MLRNGELKRLRPLLLFFLGYTLLFLAWDMLVKLHILRYNNL